MKETDPEKSAKCPTCGERLPPDSPRGLCAACLMVGALEPTVDGKSDVSASPPNSPPTLERVRAAFPQFEILALIGAGGMGSVYKARQPQLDRLVALKILTVGNRDERFTERFKQEAKTLARLSHPNIVTVFDYGETEGFYFLLMEFVEGLNLRQIMSAERLASEQALVIVPPICDALQYAHDLGIVHRDIKPDNILMDRSGRVKIADFGIARLLEQPVESGDKSEQDAGGEPSLTQDMILGTPNYMAPEQKSDPEVVDHRADIYSLGVVFYEMLTGERPDTTLTLPSQRVQVDVRLDEVVLRALAKSPEMRFQSAEEFTKTLAQVTTKTSDSPAKQSIEEPLSTRRRWITAFSAMPVIFAIMLFSGAIEILLMAFVGFMVFAWYSIKLVPNSSHFSRTARSLLGAVAVPIVFILVTTITNLVPPKGSNSSRQKVPELQRLNIDGETVITVDDGLRTHYVFHFDGKISSSAGMSHGGEASKPIQWSRHGAMVLPTGKRLEFRRYSDNPAEFCKHDH